jgi:hypothetical protein
MKKKGTKKLKNKKQEKRVSYTLSMPGDFPEKLEPLIDKAAYKIRGTKAARSHVLQFMVNILHNSSKKSPSEDARTSSFYPEPIENYNFTAKDYSAHMKAYKLLVDTQFDEIPVSFLLEEEKRKLIESIEKMNLWTEIKSFAKKDLSSAKKISDIEELMTLAQDFFGKALADEISGVITSKIEHSERMSDLMKLYTSVYALLLIAKIKEALNKDESQKDRSLYYMFYFLGACIGEAMHPSHRNHREMIDEFFSMGTSDRVTEKRWKDLKSLKKEAEVIADNQWSQEDEILMHNEMAKEIYKSLKPEYPTLHKKEAKRLSKINAKKTDDKKTKLSIEELTEEYLTRAIRKAIIPVAKKWEPIKGRVLVWGREDAQKPKIK